MNAFTDTVGSPAQLRDEHHRQMAAYAASPIYAVESARAALACLRRAASIAWDNRETALCLALNSAANDIDAAIGEMRSKLLEASKREVRS